MKSPTNPPCDQWTVEECINYLARHYGGTIVQIAMQEISTDDVEAWRNEVRRRAGT